MKTFKNKHPSSWWFIFASIFLLNCHSESSLLSSLHTSLLVESSFPIVMTAHMILNKQMTSDHVSAIRLRIHELSWSVKVETTKLMSLLLINRLMVYLWQILILDLLMKSWKFYKIWQLKRVFLEPLLINLSKNVKTHCWYLILLTSSWNWYLSFLFHRGSRK